VAIRVGVIISDHAYTHASDSDCDSDNGIDSDNDNDSNNVIMHTGGGNQNEHASKIVACPIGAGQ
jgi:hypothetical protein